MYLCYTFDAVIQVNELDYVFSSTFFDVSNLGGAFLYVFVMKKLFMLLFKHFIDITVKRFFNFWNVLF